MSDLNEVTRLENDLKKLIEDRNNFKPQYNEPYYDDWDEIQKKAEIISKNAPTFMHVKEHGQPYKTTFMENIIATLMCVKEHGQPQNSITYMGVKEHGQPFNTLTHMMLKEHGQPYKK
jgi:hypothetical protein